MLVDPQCVLHRKFAVLLAGLSDVLIGEPALQFDPLLVSDVSNGLIARCLLNHEEFFGLVEALKQLFNGVAGTARREGDDRPFLLEHLVHAEFHWPHRFVAFLPNMHCQSEK